MKVPCGRLGESLGDVQSRLAQEFGEHVMKKTIGFAVAAALVIATTVTIKLANGATTEGYRFVEVEQGDVEYVVSSTGSLDAITTVQVGTQVSGQIAAIYVDFNDRVTKGQLIARIDPTLLEQEVRSAEATLARNEAEVEHWEREFSRNENMYANQVITESEFNVAQYNVAVARANMQAAEVSLDRATQNLAYTEITAPINGVVIERTVDVGQTVAASLSAPELFLIAEDLSQMEILVSVDESDIGLIRDGQETRFTVQAYPEKTFTGTVSQVRLQSVNDENVVNYTVVVKVENPDGTLLPGMTATVDFSIEKATNILKVPNAALRFQATDQMLAALTRPVDQPRPNGTDTADRVPLSEQGGTRVDPQSLDTLWYLNADGTLATTLVRTGITDGQYTEVEADALAPGMQVIAGVTQRSQSGSTSPFQSQQQSSGPPRAPGS